MGQGSLACIRYLLFAFTLVFVIFGILLVYTGFSAFISLNKYDLVVHNSPDGATIVLLVTGFAIFFIAFLGCCGAITSNTFMLRTFSFIIAVLLIIELVSVSFVFAFRKTIHEEMQKGIGEAITKYNESDTEHNAITRIINDIQQNFQCCGGSNYTDWKNNPAYNSTILPMSLPMSCCPKESKVPICNVAVSDHYEKGCVDVISDELKNSFSYLGWVGVVVILTQVVGIFFSCMLSNRQREYTYV